MPRWGTIGDDGRVYMGGGRTSAVGDGFTVDLDPNLDEKVEKMPEVKVRSKDAANDIAELARSTAPQKTGRYADSIKVQETKGGYRVFASDQKASWVEFGIPSRGQAAHWTLRNAAAALGYKFKKRRG